MEKLTGEKRFAAAIPNDGDSPRPQLKIPAAITVFPGYRTIEIEGILVELPRRERIAARRVLESNGKFVTIDVLNEAVRGAGFNRPYTDQDVRRLVDRFAVSGYCSALDIAGPDHNPYVWTDLRVNQASSKKVATRGQALAQKLAKETTEVVVVRTKRSSKEKATVTTEVVPFSEKKTAFDFEATFLAARAGDVDAFGELMQHYEHRLVTFLLKRTGCLEDAKDLFQDTCINSFRGLPKGDARLENPAFFLAWLYKIARNKLIDQVRGTHPASSLDNPSSSFALEDPNSKQVTLEVENRELVERALSMVSTPEQRRTLELRFLEDQSIAATAAKLGKKPDAIKQLQTRAIRTILMRMSQQGVDIEGLKI